MALATPTTSTTATAAAFATDSTLDQLLASPRPTLLLAWNGDSLRTDLKTEFDKVVTEFGQRVQILKVDTSHNPKAAARFEVSNHPVLIGWHNGQQLSRRVRPWGTDVRGLAEQLAALAPPAPLPAVTSVPAAANGTKPLAKNNKPVHVTEATFEATVINSPLPALVDFWASWCGPCKQIAPVLEKLAAEFAGQFLIAKVDVDANPALSQAFSIQSIPYLAFFKNHKMVGQLVGAYPEPNIRDAIKQVIAAKV